MVHIGQDHVFLALSAAQEGSLSRAELCDAEGTLTVALGDPVDAFVVALRDGIQLSRRLGQDLDVSDMLEQARDHEIPVEGQVTGVNAGGLEISLRGVRGFCPMGQVDLTFVDEPQQFIGQTLTFLVREVKERGRQVVLSRRALLQAARAEQASKLLATLAVGQRLTGKVARLASFAACSSTSAASTAWCPSPSWAYGHVARAEDILQVGDSLSVEVVRLEPDPKHQRLRIGLSRRATLDDPMDAHADALVAGTQLEGQVVRLEPFGAFIELFPGVQGLAHISQLSGRRLNHPSEVLAVGQAVKVEVLSVDREARRIGLALEAAAGERAEVAKDRLKARRGRGRGPRAPGRARRSRRLPPQSGRPQRQPGHPGRPAAPTRQGRQIGPIASAPRPGTALRAARPRPAEPRRRRVTQLTNTPGRP